MGSKYLYFLSSPDDSNIYSEMRTIILELPYLFFLYQICTCMWKQVIYWQQSLPSDGFAQGHDYNILIIFHPFISWHFYVASIWTFLQRTQSGYSVFAARKSSELNFLKEGNDLVGVTRGWEQRGLEKWRCTRTGNEEPR